MATIVGHVDVCAACAGDIDPDNHCANAETGEVFCSAECWSEGVLG